MHYMSKAIQKRNTSNFHAEASLHAQLHGATIKPLDELLGDAPAKAFDEKTDEHLEKLALQRLKEARLNHGRQ